MTSTVAKKAQPIVSIEDRLEYGNLTVAEVCGLAHRSRTSFYADLKAGRVKIVKFGRKSVVPGEVARRYIRGEAVSA